MSDFGAAYFLFLSVSTELVYGKILQAGGECAERFSQEARSVGKREEQGSCTPGDNGEHILKCADNNQMNIELENIRSQLKVFHCGCSHSNGINLPPKCKKES